jgi:hypothetical protein
MTSPSIRTSPERTRRRLPARDRGWLALDNLRVLGPFAGVTAAGLRDALRGMHAARPTDPAVCLLDRPNARWVSLSVAGFAAFSDRLVVAVDDPGGDDATAADAVTRYLIDASLDDRPLLLATCRGVVGAKISHAVGDGRVVNTLFPELVRAAAEGRPAGPEFPVPTRLPAARAVLHHFGRHPRRLLGALPLARPPATGTGTVGQASPWRPDVAYTSVRSANALSDIRAWRDSELPGVSTAAVLFAATAAAFARCGLAPKWPGAVVLVDVRRYLPPGCAVNGNFSWGHYLRPADLTDPRAVHETLAGELSAGGALAMLALRTGRLMLSPRRGTAPVPETVGRRPRPELTLTHVGRLDGYTDLPWAAPAERRHNISVPTTGGPEAVTVSFTELSGALYINASFHRSTFDADAVDRAVRLVRRDPVGLVRGA